AFGERLAEAPAMLGARELPFRGRDHGAALVEHVVAARLAVGPGRGERGERELGPAAGRDEREEAQEQRPPEDRDHHRSCITWGSARLERSAAAGRLRLGAVAGWHTNPDDRAAASALLEGRRAPEAPHSFAHAHEAERSRVGHALLGDALAVVAHLEHE